MRMSLRPVTESMIVEFRLLQFISVLDERYSDDNIDWGPNDVSNRRQFYSEL